MSASIDHVQIAIPAGGEDAARAFYGAVIGLTEIPKPADQATRGGCWFEIGSQQIHIGVDPDFRPAKKAHVAFMVDDLGAIRAKVAAAGLPTRSDIPVPGRDRFFTDDLHGNRVEIVALA